MGLGGYDVGVTTEEMAAACRHRQRRRIHQAPDMAAGGGLRGECRHGERDLRPQRHEGDYRLSAAGYLESVITSGTGTEAYFSGMTIAGKTGTTDDNRDRYFVGFSLYYCAAVWTGYESNDELSYGMGNGSRACGSR